MKIRAPALRLLCLYEFQKITAQSEKRTASAITCLRPTKLSGIFNRAPFPIIIILGRWCKRHKGVLQTAKQGKETCNIAWTFKYRGLRACGRGCATVEAHSGLV